jgi:hypothetical protein
MLRVAHGRFTAGVFLRFLTVLALVVSTGVPVPPGGSGASIGGIGPTVVPER